MDIARAAIRSAAKPNYLQDQQKASAPLVLDAVNLAVMNDGKHHRINMMTKLPKKVGDSIKMVVAFDVEANKFSEIKGSVFLEGNNVRLPEVISAYLPFDISMTTGAIDIKLWSQWQQAKLVSIKADAQIKNGLFARKGKGNFVVNHMDTQLNWQVNDNQWQLDINRFLLESLENSKKTSQKWPDTIVSLAGMQARSTGTQNLKMFAKQLDLAEATKLVQFFAPLSGEQSQLLGQSQLNGMLRDFSFYAEPETKSFAVAGWFDALSVEALKTMPGIENINGQVKGSDTLGVVEISGQDIRIKASGLFDKPILLNKFNSILVGSNRRISGFYPPGR